MLEILVYLGLGLAGFVVCWVAVMAVGRLK